MSHDKEKETCGLDSIGRFYCSRKYMQQRIDQLEAQRASDYAKIDEISKAALAEIEQLEREKAELRRGLAGLIDAVDNCRLDSPPIDTDRFERLMCEREIAIKLFADKAIAGEGK